LEDDVLGDTVFKPKRVCKKGDLSIVCEIIRDVEHMMCDAKISTQCGEAIIKLLTKKYGGVQEKGEME